MKLYYLTNQLEAGGDEKLVDNPDAIDKRLSIYRREIYPMLDYFNDQGVPIVHMSGVGTVGSVHDEIERELASRGIVKEA